MEKPLDQLVKQIKVIAKGLSDEALQLGIDVMKSEQKKRIK